VVLQGGNPLHHNQDRIPNVYGRKGPSRSFGPHLLDVSVDSELANMVYELPPEFLMSWSALSVLKQIFGEERLEEAILAALNGVEAIRSRACRNAMRRIPMATYQI
jgi:hypothetical protein